MRRGSFCLWASVVVVGAASFAYATPITLLIDSNLESTENTGAKAVVRFDFSEEGAEDRLTVTIENTTPTSIGSKLTAVGFEVPTSLALSISFAPGGTSSFFDELTFNDSISPGWLDAPGGYDVMITSDRKFEGGGPNGAPAALQAQTVVLNLGTTPLTPDELRTAFAGYYSGLATHFVVGRFQAVGPDGEGSDKAGGRVSNPEPATVALLTIGGVVLLSRRRTPVFARVAR